MLLLSGRFRPTATTLYARNNIGQNSIIVCERRNTARRAEKNRSFGFLSALLQSTEEFEQGGPLSVRQSANPFSQLVRGPRGLGGRANCSVQSGGWFSLPGQEPFQINVERNVSTIMGQPEW